MPRVLRPSDVPAEELRRGVEVEHEHDVSREGARQIAMDHFEGEGVAFYIGHDLIERVMGRGFLGELLHMVRQSMPVKTNDLIERLQDVERG